MTDDKSALALMNRQALPEDLKVLLEKYPRRAWNSGHEIGQMGTFWIERHNMFRELGARLVESIDDLREGRVETRTFAPWFARRLNHFLGDLQGHHHIEDSQYFPLFAAADTRLAPGFELLEQDHELIHTLLESNARAATAFYQDLMAENEHMPFSRDAYAGEAQNLLTGLLRHLEDEEDLLIPLLLDQGEDKFLGY